MAEITIRYAHIGDLPFLRDVQLSASAAFLVLTDYIPNKRTVPSEILKEMILAEKLWVGVNDQNRLVGFIGCRNMDGLFYIHEVSVAHDFQKQGIGRRLMHAALDDAVDANYSAAGLTTRRDAPWNMPFYRSLGFGEITKFSEWPALHMQLQKEIAEDANPSIRCAMIRQFGTGLPKNS